jgi:hypothetical protein
MFFAEGEIEKLPEKLQEELELFYKKYEYLHDLYDNKRDINKEMIECIILSLRIYLKWGKKSKKEVRDLMSGAVGNIPITLDLDNIKLSKKVEEIINPLIDIIDSHANLHINREKLTLEVLNELEKLQGGKKK